MVPLAVPQKALAASAESAMDVTPPMSSAAFLTTRSLAPTRTSAPSPVPQ